MSHLPPTPGTVPWSESCQSIHASPHGSIALGFGTSQCAIQSGQRPTRSRWLELRCDKMLVQKLGPV